MQKSKGHSYSQGQVDTLQLMLDATGVAPLVKLRKILQYAIQEGIAAYQDNIMADKFLVHPENVARCCWTSTRCMRTVGR